MGRWNWCSDVHGPSYMAPYVNDTTFDDSGVIESVDRDYELDRWWNPLAIYNNKLFRETERRRLPTGQLTYSPFRGLDIVANAGFDQSLLEGDEFIAADFYEAQNIPNAVSSGNWSQGIQDNLNLGTNATYRIREDDETRLSVMVGFESQGSREVETAWASATQTVPHTKTWRCATVCFHCWTAPFPTRCRSI